MANYSYSFMGIGQARFEELVKTFKSAKAGMQIALGAALYQAIEHNNPNWINTLFGGLWLTTKVGNKYGVSKTGRAILSYMVADQHIGGLGLSGVFKVDREKKRINLDKGRFLTLDEIDHDTLWATLAETHFDDWAKPKTPKTQYQPDKAIDRINARLVKAVEKGETLDVEDWDELYKSIEELRTNLRAYANR